MDELCNNLFAANERYLIAQKIYKSRRVNKSEVSNKVSSYSIGIESTKPTLYTNPFSSCTLCYKSHENGNHGINKCLTFQTASQKVSKLNELSGCCKCANLDHTSDECKFRFRKSCIYCDSSHFSFLCSVRKPSFPNGKLDRVAGDYRPKPGNNYQSAIAVVTGISNDLECILFFIS